MLTVHLLVQMRGPEARGVRVWTHACTWSAKLSTAAWSSPIQGTQGLLYSRACLQILLGDCCSDYPSSRWRSESSGCSGLVSAVSRSSRGAYCCVHTQCTPPPTAVHLGRSASMFVLALIRGAALLGN
jgi:hypothetical protein